MKDVCLIGRGAAARHRHPNGRALRELDGVRATTERQRSIDDVLRRAVDQRVPDARRHAKLARERASILVGGVDGRRGQRRSSLRERGQRRGQHDRRRRRRGLAFAWTLRQQREHDESRRRHDPERDDRDASPRHGANDTERSDVGRRNGRTRPVRGDLLLGERVGRRREGRVRRGRRRPAVSRDGLGNPRVDEDRRGDRDGFFVRTRRRWRRRTLQRRTRGIRRSTGRRRRSTRWLRRSAGRRRRRSSRWLRRSARRWRWRWHGRIARCRWRWHGRIARWRFHQPLRDLQFDDLARGAEVEASPRRRAGHGLLQRFDHPRWIWHLQRPLVAVLFLVRIVAHEGVARTARAPPSHEGSVLHQLITIRRDMLDLRAWQGPRSARAARARGLFACRGPLRWFHSARP